MSEDPISKVYCVGNSKAIIRARWDNLYTFELEYPRFIHSEFMTQSAAREGGQNGRKNNDDKRNGNLCRRAFQNQSG